MNAASRRLWRAGALGWLGAASLAFLAPVSVQAPVELVSLDKLAHLLIFVTGAWWMAHARPAWRWMLGLAVYALVIESLQGLSSTRSFEAADLLANGLGIILGWLGQRQLPLRTFPTSGVGA